MKGNTRVDIALLDGDAPSIDSVRRIAESRLVRPGLAIGSLASLPCRREVWEQLIHRFSLEESGSCLLTAGGAGFKRSDWIPDLTAAVISRPVPGIPEAFRHQGETLSPLSPLFRGTAGLTARGGLVINLPGAEAWLAACLGSLANVLGHALDKAAGDTAECGRGPDR